MKVYAALPGLASLNAASARMAGLDRVGLIFVYDPRDSLHVDRDVHPHDVSSACARDEYRGR